MARNVIIELQQSGIKIPEDILVAGFDNVFPVKFIYPPLTTADISFEEMGELSVKVLLDQIEGNPVKDIYHHRKERIIFRQEHSGL